MKKTVTMSIQEYDKLMDIKKNFDDRVNDLNQDRLIVHITLGTTNYMYQFGNDEVNQALVNEVNQALVNEIQKIKNLGEEYEYAKTTWSGERLYRRRY